ncbi:hypothetical protein HDU81_004720 [Chytriomyces hyalinus]|nr:hypothetical protein HDU81_004720 [Chytriomyces hyalinus]
MDAGPAAVLATATRAAVHASLTQPIPQPQPQPHGSIVEGQIVVLEVVTEVRVTMLEEFVIDHGTPVPVHLHSVSDAVVSASFLSRTETLVAVASQSNAAGDSNVLIYLGAQGQPSPTQSVMLSTKEQAEAGVPSAVVAEIVVPLCAIFFCFGLLIAWRVIRKAQEKKGRGGQNTEVYGGSDEESGGGPLDSSRSRLFRLLWQKLSGPKSKHSPSDNSDTTSIASSSSSISSASSSFPPHDPDPVFEPGLAYPARDTPSDPFAHAPSNSAGHVNDMSQMVPASAPPAEKFAMESNIPTSFLVATDSEERILPSSPKTTLYPRESSYFSSIPIHHSMLVSQSNQRSAPARNQLGQHNRSVPDTLLLLETLDAPPPAYSESSTTVLTLHHLDTCSEFLGLGLGSEDIHIPSAPPLTALAPESLVVHVGSQMGSELSPPRADQVQSVLAQRRRSWSADASRAWLV